MIRGFTVTTPAGEKTTFTLARPEETGCLVTDVTGLGTPKANIMVQTVYNADGGLFNHARTETRNITFSFQMLDGMAPAGRRRIYRCFTLKRLVTVTFHTDARDYEARGYVESVTPNIFTEKETVQVSIVCPQPYLETPGRWQSGIGFYTVGAGITFPIKGPGITFGTQDRASSITLDYTGEVMTGFKWWIPMTKNPGLVSLYNHTLNQVLQIDMNVYENVSSKVIGPGYTLEVDSRPETFGARVHQANNTTFHATGIVTASSVWPELQPGINQLEVYSNKARIVEASTEISVYYSPLYMGL